MAFVSVAIYLLSITLILLTVLTKQGHKVILPGVTQLIATFHNKLGFILSLTVLTQVTNFQNQYFDNTTISSFFSGSVSGLSIFLIVISCVLLVFGLNVNCQPLISDEGIFSRRSNYVEAITVGIKVLLALNIISGSSVFENKTFVSTLVLALVVLKGIYSYFSLPYYSVDSYKILFFGLSLEILFGIVSLIRSAISEEYSNFINFFYIIIMLAPIAFKLLWGYSFDRMLQIVASPAEKIKSESLGLVRIAMISKILDKAEVGLKADVWKF